MNSLPASWFHWIASTLALFPQAHAASLPPLTWTMINVNNTRQQADAHLLEFPDGTRFLVDASVNGDVLIPYLKAQGVKKIDQILISHPHNDHYGGLTALLNSGITVGKLRLNLPNKEVCDAEKPWGCDYSHLVSTIQSYKDYGISVSEVRGGDIIYSKGKIQLKALYAYNGVNPPIGRTDINDTSTILLLTYGKNKVLFTGDLNQPLGEFLSKKGRNLEANILKVPHHGTEGVAPNAFFDRVNPSVALVPSPKELWLSDRSKRIREYFQSKKIPAYVNGIDGHITVRLTPQGYSIVTQKTPQPLP